MGVARIYTLPIPYAGVELFDVDFEQSADVMYLTHPEHPVMKLSRYGAASWTINAVTFGSKTVAPTGVNASPSGSTSDAGYKAQNYQYVVTAIDGSTGEESLQSGIASAVNDLNIDGHANTITWTAVAGAVRYKVYRLTAGVFGYIGQTAGTGLLDNNVGPDAGNTPPTASNPIGTPDNYPARVALHQQRTLFGRTNTNPSAIFGTRSADLENFNSSFPLQADDSIEFRLLARQVNAIEHMVSIGNGGLLVLTRDCAFSVSGSQGGALAGNDAPDIRTQSYRGCGKTRPALIDDVVMFVTNKGAAVRTIGYTFESDGYKGNDLTVYAPHFFKGYTIVDMAWAEYPTATLWCVRSDGMVVVLTWQAEQNVWGWTLCDFGGVVESVASISLGGEDVPYFVVRRYVAGANRRLVERMSFSNWTDSQQAVFTDCSRTYVGTPSAAFFGFSHLEGESLQVQGDGIRYDGVMVNGGVIRLPTAVSKLVVGKAFTSLMETLPIASSQNPIAGKKRQLVKADVQVLNSVALKGGIDEADMFDLRDDDNLPQPLGPPQSVSGFLQLDASPAWDDDATVVVVQDGPFPMTILSVNPEYEISR